MEADDQAQDISPLFPQGDESDYHTCESDDEFFSPINLSKLHGNALKLKSTASQVQTLENMIAYLRIENRFLAAKLEAKVAPPPLCHCQRDLLQDITDLRTRIAILESRIS